MPKYRPTASHDLGFRVLAGNCLAMAQGILGAPVDHDSATEAAEATQYRHYDRSYPLGAVLWFDHYGTYGEPGAEEFKNWGHVTVSTELGIASSSPNPGEVSAPYFYASIEEVERTFNASFRFWSEDINGLRVVESEEEMTPAQEKKLDRVLYELGEVRKEQSKARALLTEVAQDVEWNNERTGGTRTTENLTNRLRRIEARIEREHEEAAATKRATE